MDQTTKAKKIRPVEFPDLPNRMFVVGYEPVGIQVTVYHPSDGIRVILNAFEEEEVVMLNVLNYSIDNNTYYRMFVVGHEPVGIQVTAYHPSDGIRVILNAFEEEEVVYLRTVFVIPANCSELT
ncbi:unnamed protein product [Arabis nemorensis]|uniref:Uncharacterized protein n=1 Tax=Arabis nemorensis TaxID=586526 RepID=A0A565BV01_9BRAS|nr:unnamed protein product [Arabis nemorensis]